MQNSKKNLELRLAYRGPVHQALEQVFEQCDVAERRQKDPVGFVHQYKDATDIELVALMASSLALGHVTAIRAKIADALNRMSVLPTQAADDEDSLRRRLLGWKHRMYTGKELAALLIGARRVQRHYGSLGQCFSVHLNSSNHDLKQTLTRFVDEIRDEGRLDRMKSYGARHLLPDPSKDSSCKRLLLFLRWMVRGPEGLDVGLWASFLSPSQLVIPVDVHIHTLARNLGLTSRTTASWQTALEITEALQRFDANDPVRFDFALCHMGMLQQCPSQRDRVQCHGCPVKSVCIWWSSEKHP